MPIERDPRPEGPERSTVSGSPTPAPGSPSSGARPAEVLDGAASGAWQAYNAMETTKRRHFGLLERLDLKRRNYNLDPSDEETRLLEWLLADHDAQVKRFTAASLALQAADGPAHAALFDYVGTLARLDTESAPGDGSRPAR